MIEQGRLQWSEREGLEEQRRGSGRSGEERSASRGSIVLCTINQRGVSCGVRMRGDRSADFGMRVLDEKRSALSLRAVLLSSHDSAGAMLRETTRAQRGDTCTVLGSSTQRREASLRS